MFCLISTCLFFLFLLFSFFVLVGLWKFFDSSLKEFGGKAFENGIDDWKKIGTVFDNQPT